MAAGGEEGLRLGEQLMIFFYFARMKFRQRSALDLHGTL